MVTVSANHISSLRTTAELAGCSIPADSYQLFRRVLDLEARAPFSSRFDFGLFWQLKTAIVSQEFIRNRFEVFFSDSFSNRKVILHSPPEEATIFDVLQGQIKVHAAFSQDWHTVLVPNAPDFELVFARNVDTGIFPWEYSLEMALDLFQTLRQFFGKSWSPEALCFNHKYQKRWEPDRLAKLAVMLDCPIHFNCSANAFRISRRSLLSKIRLERFERMDPLDCHRALLELSPVDNFPALVRKVLREVATDKIPCTDDLLLHLRMPKRNFQRRLKYFGTSFNAMRDEVLHEKYSVLHKSESFSFREVSEAMQFASPPGLHRARRRWAQNAKFSD